jgi:hypothetical protein
MRGRAQWMLACGVPEILMLKEMGLAHFSLGGAGKGLRMRRPLISEELMKSSSGSSGCLLHQTQKEVSAFQLRVKMARILMRFSRIENYLRS